MKKIEKQYAELMQQCDANLDRIEKELPGRGFNLTEELQRRGISRRQFIKWSSMMTATLMLPPVFQSRVARAAENFSRVPVIWLHLAECTGCTESVIRTQSPDILQLLLDNISLEYHETLLAASGDQAEERLQEALEEFEGQFVCVCEGGIPTGTPTTAQEGQYLTLGPHAKTGLDLAQEVTSKAAAVISLGSCAAFGNVQAALPNPTEAKGIGDALDIGVVNIPGCPPNAVSFIGTVLYVILFKKLPEVDDEARPLFAYGRTVHDYCERLDNFKAGNFVKSWDDDGAKQGYCLFQMGCKGPTTYNNCSRARFNQNTSWPVAAGHGCIGCSEKDFWDNNSPLYTLPSAATEEAAEERIARYKAVLNKIGVPLDSPTAKGLGIKG